MKRHPLFVGALTAALLGPGRPLSAAEHAEPRELRAEAPVTTVTVYSDRARVTRTARLSLSGAARVTLPLLLPGTDPASVRVEARGADVQRVDLQAVQESEMPVDAARQLLDKLERLDDQISRAQGEADVLRAQAELINRLTPAVPVSEPARGVPRLRAGGWAAVLAFVRAQLEHVQERALRGGEQLRGLQRDRRLLLAQADLAGILGQRAGLRVLPTLRGSGEVELRVSYLVAPARWLPSYDIQLLPDSGQVELRFFGRVSQETGEDWSEAQVTLSTAVPTLAAQLPRLNTWKIGARERFIPTPRAASTPAAAPPPSAPALILPGDPREALRSRLLARLGGAARGDVMDQRKQDKGERFARQDVDADGVRDEVDVLPIQAEELRRQPSAPPPPPPPPPPAPVEAPTSMAEPMPQLAQKVVRGRSYESVVSSAPGYLAGATTPVPTERVGLAPPPSYQPPRYPGHLPAALSGGYDLTYPALQRESVRSGKGARNIPLFSRRFPVSVVRKLLPAVAPEAFLVADIKNPTGQPLPGGVANLFVGADPAGVATLSLVAPGESFTLPLGLDRALRPVRNVRLHTSERGVFNKDEITEYVVTTELANPYRAPLAVWLLDQIPLPGDKSVEVKLLRSEPAASHDAIKGTLEWRLTVPPGAKVQTTFVYTLRRPIGARLYQ